MRRPLLLPLVLSSVVLLSSLLVYHARRARAQTGKGGACCSASYPEAPRELDFPYYSLRDGFRSSLNLVNNSPRSIDLSLAIRSLAGQALLATETIGPSAKLPIDLASFIANLGGDPTGAFAEGSIAVYYVGTIMPVVGQITVTKPAVGLIYEVEMVENDPGRSDIPSILNGLWWGLAGGRGAKIMVANTGDDPVTADAFLDFQGQRHQSAPLSFNPHETKVISISGLLGSLNASPAQAPEGGITIIQRGPNPRLIGQGRVLDPVTGFSTTLEFADPAKQKSSALHAVGLAIGKPTKDSPYGGAGTFTPHVILRNLAGTPQTVTITVEYPKGATWNSAEGPGGPSVPTIVLPGVRQGAPHGLSPNPNPADLTGQLALAPLSVGPYATVDFSLDPVMGQLPLPLPFCSIRIQYSGMPGAVIAQVASVEARSDLVVDARVANEGDGWAGSGANPWHLDKVTESILFLTNESDRPARIGFQVTADGVDYYLTRLQLAAHETRAIGIRSLRDAQAEDFTKNKIPAGATDGAVHWIRLDNVPVTGRLVVISRRAGIASSYDCCTCPCNPSYSGVTINGRDPNSSFDVLVGTTFNCTATAKYTCCNGNNTFNDVNASWLSQDATIATVDASGVVTGVSGGSTSIQASYSDNVVYFNGSTCVTQFQPMQGGSTARTRQAKWAVLVSDSVYNTVCIDSTPTVERDRTYAAYDALGAISFSQTFVLNETLTSPTACGMVTGKSESGVVQTIDQIKNCNPSCTFESNQTFNIGPDTGQKLPVKAKDCPTCPEHNGWHIYATTTGVIPSDN